MKKIIALILSALTAFAFVACGKKESKKPVLDPPPTGETEQTGVSSKLPPDLTGGTLYFLSEACDRNLIKREELMHAAYYWMGEVVEVINEEENFYSLGSEYNRPKEEWKNIQELPFTPTKELGEIPSTLEGEVKISFGEKFAEQIAREVSGLKKFGIDTDRASFINSVSIDHYLGEYDGKYVMTLNQGLWARAAAIGLASCKGIGFYDRPDDFFVYIVNKD